MNIKKFKILEEAIVTGKYKVIPRYNKNTKKLGIDVFNQYGKKLKPVFKNEYMRTSWISLYVKPDFISVNKFELFCYIAGIPVLDVEISADYVKRNIHKIKSWAKKQIIWYNKFIGSFNLNPTRIKASKLIEISYIAEVGLGVM